MSLFIASLFWYIQTPTVELREQPKPEAEIVSQALFSENVQIIEERGDWAKIELAVDKYKGWVPKSALCSRSTEFFTSLKVNRLAAHIYHLQDTIYGPMLTLPFESRLELLEPKEESTSRWLKVALPDGREAYIQRGDVELPASPLTREEMCTLSQRFLGLPYTWGGRSSFGYDCSGFVQMLYRHMGIALPRDSKDQMRWEGLRSIPLAELQRGDLIFFGLTEDKIRHVGLYLGQDQFIHATVAENAPYIHISYLSAPEWNGSGRFTYRAARTLK